MWSVKAVIRNRVLADGLHAVFIRLTMWRKTAYMSTGIRVEKRHWNAKQGLLKLSAPLSMDSNDYLERKINLVKRTVMDPDNAGMSPDKLLKLAIDRPTDFYAYAARYLAIREDKGQYDTVEIYTDHINQLRKYAPKLAIADIDAPWISRLVRHLSKTNNSQTLSRKLKFFAGIYKLAIKDGVAKANVFEGQHIKAAKPKIKNIPTTEDIRALIAVLPSLNAPQRLAADMFLTQFFTRGTRISDIILLRRDSLSLEAQYVEIIEKKTGEAKRMQLHPVVLEIMAQYEHPVYVFPMCRWLPNPSKTEKENTLEMKREISTATTKINKGIALAFKAAGVTKHLTTHCSRHGFATLAIQTLGDIRKVQGLLTHAQHKTTEGYLHDLERADYNAEESLIYDRVVKKAP